MRDDGRLCFAQSLLRRGKLNSRPGYLKRYAANNPNMNYEAFSRKHPNAFSTIDDDGFALLLQALNATLESVSYGQFINDGHPSQPMDGDLELAFANGTVLRITVGHHGVRVLPEPIQAYGEHDGIAYERLRLEDADSAIGTACKQVDILLETANCYGKELLTTAIVFRFPTLEIGFEDFWKSRDSDRSRVALNPPWTGFEVAALKTAAA